MSEDGPSRRKALTLGASAAALPLVHIRTAGAAGKLSVAFWNHWVPAGNDTMRKQVAAFVDKHKVEVQADFITSVGNKNILTLAAEAQAKTGHDVQAFPNWEIQNHADMLEPMDDLMKQLTGQYGTVSKSVSYLGQVKGRWMAVPSSSGSQNKLPCARISLMESMAGIDVQALYPASGETGRQDEWTFDAFLKAAEACHKGGKPFGIGLGQTADSEDFAGAVFGAFGAELVNAKGEITLKTDAVRQALEFGKKLLPFLPPDAVSYDDASNNRALISGQSALICMGSRAAGQPACRRRLLDVQHAEGAERTGCAVAVLFLGQLELQRQQVCGQGIHRVPQRAGEHRGTGEGRRRLRHPALRQHAGLQGVGGGRATERHGLQLSDPQEARRDPVGGDDAGPTRDCGPGL